MNKPKPPCGKVCPLRKLGCKHDCEKWQKYEVDMAEYRKEAEKAYLQHMNYAEFKEDRYMHHIKTKGEKRK